MRVRDHAAQTRYELEEDGAVSFATYREERDGRRALLHVETPPALRGRGAAGRLMAAIVAEARQNKRQLRARCPYAVTYLERHPDVGDVLAL